MMHYVLRFVVIFCLVITCGAHAAIQKSQQKEVTVFMEKMYSYSANMFEGRIFDGKDNPQKQCLLLKEFFLPNLLTPEDKKWHGCDIKGKVFLRYPGLPSEDFDIYGGPGAIRKPTFSTPVIEGEKAVVSTTTKEFGKTVFFLTKTEQGWRIENALYYEKTPTEANICHGQFLKIPTPDQLKFRPVCRDY